MTDLSGLGILSTRPLHQSLLFIEELQSAGATVFACPCLEITASPSQWLAHLPALSDIDQAIFTSPNAVQFFFETFKESWPASIQTLSIGQGTAKALARYQIPMRAKPEIANSENLLKLPCLQDIRGQTIVLIKGEGGRTLIAENLRKRGATLIEICSYKRLLPTIDQDQINILWRSRAVDIILFTSQEAMQNLFTLVGKEKHAWLRETPCLVISERLVKAAKDLGIKTIVQSNPETMIQALHTFRQGLANDQNQD